MTTPNTDVVGTDNIIITTFGGTTILIPMGSASVPPQRGATSPSPSVKAAPAPKEQPATKQPKAATTSPSAKPKRRRVAKPSAKPIYDEIRSLTTSGRHDEAIALAESKGWSHVVDSVNAHRAKQAEAGKASRVVTGKAGSAPAASKKQVKTAASKKPYVPKPKASKAAAPKQPKAATHVEDGEAIPTNLLTEGDLAEYWGLCIAKGNADIARAALKSSKQSLLAAIKDGDKVAIKVQHVRVKTLEHLLAEAGQKPS